MMDPTRHKHIYWRSRRGMLELELKLVPFLRDHFDALSAPEKQAYEAILSEEDWQIFDWLQRRDVPHDATQARVIEKILENVGQL
jgi:antitoxin CptB